MTRDRMTWIASTARLSGREIKANNRLEKRIAELEGTGILLPFSSRISPPLHAS